MSKLKAKLEKPSILKEYFHGLETTTPKAKMPEGGAWDLVRKCIESEDTNIRVYGVYLNAVLTERKVTHLLSGAYIAKLLKNQNLISRKSITNEHAASIVSGLEKDEVIKVLRPLIPFKKAAVVQITEKDLISHINMEIGAEISDQYSATVLSFYDTSNESSSESSTEEFQRKVPLESSTSDSYSNTISVCSSESAAALDNNISGQENKNQLASRSTPSELPSKNNTATETTPSSAAPLQNPVGTYKNLDELTAVVKQLWANPKLTDWEKNFVISLPKKFQTYGSLTPKQEETLSDINKKVNKKPKLSESAATNLLKSFNGSVEPLIAGFKQYDYTKNKEPLSELIWKSKAIPYEDKKALAAALSIRLAASV
jgi:hypothetical protein